MYLRKYHIQFHILPNERHLSFSHDTTNIHIFKELLQTNILLRNNVIFRQAIFSKQNKFFIWNVQNNHEINKQLIFYKRIIEFSKYYTKIPEFCKK